MTGDLTTGPALDLPPTFRAFSAVELRSLAAVLDSMPAPDPAEVEEVVLATHTPHGDETFGSARWYAPLSVWVFVIAEVDFPPDLPPYRGALPDGSDPDQERRP